MLHIQYPDTDFDELLEQFTAVYQDVTPKNNSLILHSPLAKGIVKTVNLPDNVDCVMMNFANKEELLLHRKNTGSSLYILQVVEILSNADNSIIKSSVFLTTTNHDWLFISPANSQVKSIAIYFSLEWLKEFLGDNIDREMVQKYMAFKLSMYHYTQGDNVYSVLLRDALNAEGKGDMELLNAENTAMLLVERFFTSMLNDISQKNFDIKIDNFDLTRIEAAEQELVRDFTILPPPIIHLAKIAAMSTSKFKACFKEIYGVPVYQYYQRQRMNKAKSMLMSKKYSVKEVGVQVGYLNLSNFAKAFKKSFDQLPSDID